MNYKTIFIIKQEGLNNDNQKLFVEDIINI